ELLGERTQLDEPVQPRAGARLIPDAVEDAVPRTERVVRRRGGLADRIGSFLGERGLLFFPTLMPARAPQALPERRQIRLGIFLRRGLTFEAIERREPQADELADLAANPSRLVGIAFVLCGDGLDRE